MKQRFVDCQQKGCDVVLKETIGCVDNGYLEDLFCNPPGTAVCIHQVHC